MLANDDGISTVIENFVLGDRSKFISKFPIIKDIKVEPTANMLGVNELSYKWKTGHAPLSEEQSDNCNWFKERAERDNPIISSEMQVLTLTDKQS